MVQQGERDMKQILVELEQSAPLVEQMSEVLEAWQSGRYMTLLIHIFSGVPDEERLVSIAKELEACCKNPPDRRRHIGRGDQGSPPRACVCC